MSDVVGNGDDDGVCEVVKVKIGLDQIMHMILAFHVAMFFTRYEHCARNWFVETCDFFQRTYDHVYIIVCNV